MASDTLRSEIIAAFLFDKRATVVSVAAKFDVDHQWVSLILRDVCDTSAITNERIQRNYRKVRFLASLGWSGARIAREMGYSQYMVWLVLRRDAA